MSTLLTKILRIFVTILIVSTAVCLWEPITGNGATQQRAPITSDVPSLTLLLLLVFLPLLLLQHQMAAPASNPAAFDLLVSHMTGQDRRRPQLPGIEYEYLLSRHQREKGISYMGTGERLRRAMARVLAGESMCIAGRVDCVMPTRFVTDVFRRHCECMDVIHMDGWMRSPQRRPIF